MRAALDSLEELLAAAQLDGPARLDAICDRRDFVWIPVIEVPGCGS